MNAVFDHVGVSVVEVDDLVSLPSAMCAGLDLHPMTLLYELIDLTMCPHDPVLTNMPEHYSNCRLLIRQHKVLTCPVDIKEML